jgi:hypothetical protein
MSLPAYNCKNVCQAPDEFFSGSPVFTVPKNLVLTLKPGWLVGYFSVFENATSCP